MTALFPERIETERLLLRWPTLDDANDMHARYARFPEVSRYMTWPPHASREETTRFVESSIERCTSGLGCEWLIFPRTGGPLKGAIGTYASLPLVKFGYCLAVDEWGQGFATEAAKAVVTVVLANPAVWRVQALCDVENYASARVLEKAGLQLEGTLRKSVVLPNLGPIPRDTLVYARVRADALATADDAGR